MAKILIFHINEGTHAMLDLSSNNNLFIPKGKTNNFQKTMAFAGSKIWNEISKEIRMAQTLQSFKEHLKKHLAEQQAQSS